MDGLSNTVQDSQYNKKILDDTPKKRKKHSTTGRTFKDKFSKKKLEINLTSIASSSFLSEIDHENIRNYLKSEDYSTLWEKNFISIFSLVTRDVCSSSEKNRNVALRTFNVLIEEKKDLLQNYDSDLLRLLFERRIMNKNKIQDEQRRKTIINIINTTEIKSILLKFIPSICKFESMSMRIFKKLVPHVEKLDLVKMLDSTVLFESFQKGIEDKDALIRRSSMSCLLAIYKTLGEDFDRFTTKFNENQQRSFNFYKKKLNEKK